MNVTKVLVGGFLLANAATFVVAAGAFLVALPVDPLVLLSGIVTEVSDSSPILFGFLALSALVGVLGFLATVVGGCWLIVGGLFD